MQAIAALFPSITRHIVGLDNGVADDQPTLIVTTAEKRPCSGCGHQCFDLIERQLRFRWHAKVGLTEDSFKWVTDAKRAKTRWKCGDDPAFPVRSHAPPSNLDYNKPVEQA